MATRSFSAPVIATATVCAAAGAAAYWLHCRTQVRNEARNEARNEEVVVTALYCFPIKSCGGISVAEAQINRLGFHLDRTWMLVKASDNSFLSQRQHPRMALIQPAFDGAGGIDVSAPGMPSINLTPVPEAQQQGQTLVTVTVWHDKVQAAHVSDECDAWFSKFLRQDVRLVAVYSLEHHERPLEPKFDASPAEANINVSFCDGFPFLLCNDASLAELNGRLASKVRMANFRPNIVVSGPNLGAFAEDNWCTVLVGDDIELRIVKPCARCTIPTINPETGVRDKSVEPLKTLRTYRQLHGATFFGQNCVHVHPSGVVRVGDKVTVLESQPDKLAFQAAQIAASLLPR